ncbi:unnamed protein product [Fusarium graminearum]|nr:unnamed protein product [Fusarium graminearum]
METYHGCVKTPDDFIILFEACRKGVLPLVQQRLLEKERQSIRSGSIFVWDELKTGIKRWTDGMSWSSGRVSGSVFKYREMENNRRRRSATNRRRRSATNQRGYDKTRKSGHGGDEGQDSRESRKQLYKRNGLVKLSLRITTSDGRRLHLVSYYSSQHGQPELQQPTNDPAMQNVIHGMDRRMYPELQMDKADTSLATTCAPIQGPPYAAPQYDPQLPAINGQLGYSYTPSCSTNCSDKRYVSPYPPVDPPQSPFGAYLYDMALTCYTETHNCEGLGFCSALAAEYHNPHLLHGDSNLAVRGKTFEVSEGYFKPIAQSNIGGDPWLSSYAYQVALPSPDPSLNSFLGLSDDWSISWQKYEYRPL